MRLASEKEKVSLSNLIQMKATKVGNSSNKKIKQSVFCEAHLLWRNIE